MLVKNKEYLKFKKTGEIEPITQEELNEALKNVTGKNKTEGKALLILLYYTGARPAEILNLTGKDIEKKGSYLLIKIATLKKGIARTIRLRIKDPLVKEVYDFVKTRIPSLYLFWNYKSSSKENPTRVLNYYVCKWFKGIRDIVPYFLRHSRLSALSMAGLTAEELRQFKGSRSISGVMPYLHLSARTMEKIARKIK